MAKLWRGDGEGQWGGASFAGVLASGVPGFGAGKWKYEVRNTKYEVAKLWRGDGEGQWGGASFAGVLRAGVPEFGAGKWKYEVRSTKWQSWGVAGGVGGGDVRGNGSTKYEVCKAGERWLGGAVARCGLHVCVGALPTDPARYVLYTRVHGLGLHASFWLCVHRFPLRNPVAPNFFTSYFVLRTSYLITSLFSCRRVIAHPLSL